MIIDILIISILLCVAHDSLQLGRMKRMMLFLAAAMIITASRIEIFVHQIIPMLNPTVVVITTMILLSVAVQKVLKRQIAFSPSH
jgi:thymidylate kinase